jgi:hypothetical protein
MADEELVVDEDVQDEAATDESRASARGMTSQAMGPILTSRD